MSNLKFYKSIKSNTLEFLFRKISKEKKSCLKKKRGYARFSTSPQYFIIKKNSIRFGRETYGFKLYSLRKLVFYSVKMPNLNYLELW